MKHRLVLAPALLLAVLSLSLSGCPCDPEEESEAFCELLEILTEVAYGGPASTRNPPTADVRCPLRLQCQAPYCMPVHENGSFELFSGSDTPSRWYGDHADSEVVFRRAACEGARGLKFENTVHPDDPGDGRVSEVYQIIRYTDLAPPSELSLKRRVRVQAAFLVDQPGPSDALDDQFGIRIDAYAGDPDTFPTNANHEAIPASDPGNWELLTSNWSTLQYEFGNAFAYDWQPLQVEHILPEETDFFVVILEAHENKQDDPAQTDDEFIDHFADHVDILIDGGPYGPIAAPDQAYTTQDRGTRILVLRNDEDWDGYLVPATLEVVSSPANGTAVVEGVGINYTPHPGFAGTDVFSYVVEDEDGLRAGAPVSVEVRPVRPPQANQDVYNLEPDNTLTVPEGSGVLANDSDPDGDRLTAVLESGPQHGTLTFQDDGGFTYTADASFTGNDQFTYRATDGRLESDIAYVYLIGNRPPIAIPDVFHASPGSETVLDVLYNDLDLDGDTLRLGGVGAAAHGQVQIMPDHRLLYRPPDGFVDSVDVFTYWAVDEHGVRSNEGLAQVLVNEGPAYDLGVGLSVSPDTVFFGGETTYTITLDNHGPNNATDIEVAFAVPPALFTVLETQATHGTFETGRWTLAALAAGVRATVMITVEPQQAPLIIQQARIVAGISTGDDPTNNTATATLTVRTD